MDTFTKHFFTGVVVISAAGLLTFQILQNTILSQKIIYINKGISRQQVIRAYPGGEESNLNCITCAYVTGSGRLLGSKKGVEIDSMSCVIRSNDAPTRGFEEDVGSRTTIRTVEAHSLDYINKMLQSKLQSGFDPHVLDDSIILGYTYRPHYLRASIEKTLDNFPEMKFYEVTQQIINETFEKDQEPLLGKNSRPSNGFYTLYILHHLCGEIHVYGMNDEHYCKRVAADKLNDTSYHYYGKSPLNCEHQLAGQKKLKLSHRFIAEKKVFRRWAEEWKNLYFHTPDWNLTSRPSAPC